MRATFAAKTLDEFSVIFATKSAVTDDIKRSCAIECGAFDIHARCMQKVSQNKNVLRFEFDDHYNAVRAEFIV